MIFRLDGGVENLLALTPVLVEWRRRFGGPVVVDTMEPAVFRLNPYVDASGPMRMGSAERFFDMNLVPWPKLLQSVTETYAERVLGDVRMCSWRTVMASSKEEAVKAVAVVPRGFRVAALCIDRNEMSDESEMQVRAVLEKEGYVAVDVGMGRCGSVGVQREAIRLANVFVGTDGPAASVAFTTDVPAVVCYTWRDSCYFAPCRKSVPFEALVHGEDDCDSGKVCLAQNGSSEFGKVYGHDCPKTSRFACRKQEWGEMVGRALRRMADKV